MVFEGTRKLTAVYAPTATLIKNASGKLLSSTEWKEYYETLHNNDPNRMDVNVLKELKGE